MSSHADRVRRCFTFGGQLTWLGRAAVVVAGIQGYRLYRSFPLEHGYTLNPTAVQVFFGALLVFFLSRVIRSMTYDRMRKHWDHAMVSNLARNIGGGYSQKERDIISSIIVSRNK
jgi:hypothetical protein